MKDSSALPPLTQGETPLTTGLQMLAEKSWVLLENQDLRQLSSELFDLAQQLKPGLRPAQIGRGADKQQLQAVRSDYIQWQDFEPETPAFRFLEELRMALNRELFLGVRNWECHFAYYPPGSFYDWHIDQSQRAGQVERVITFVLYLNSEWRATDGGELEIKDQAVITPSAGRLVLFKSDEVCHRVRVSQKDRWSLTGWFLRSTLNKG